MSLNSTFLKPIIISTYSDQTIFELYPFSRTINSASGGGCDLHSWALKFPCCYNGESNPSCMIDKLREFSREMGPEPIDKVEGKKL